MEIAETFASLTGKVDTNPFEGKCRDKNGLSGDSSFNAERSTSEVIR